MMIIIIIKIIIIVIIIIIIIISSTGFEKYIAAIGIEMRVEHPQKNTKNSFIWDSKDFETGTWMQKKNIILSIIVQESVRPLATGYCPF